MSDRMFGNFYQGKNVFVTGHTGFKGSWLSAWLLKLGAKVTGYALPPLYDESHFELLGLASKIRHVEGDVRDRQRLTAAMAEAKPDIVFHLAAQALVREAYRDPAATFDTNVMGGVNLCEAVGKTESVRTLVYITSDKCYRNVDWEWGYRETDTLGGRDPYSASKGCAELVFAAYWTSFLSKSDRVKAASTRAGNVIGGGDWAKDRLIPDCIRALRKKETIEIHHPDSTRPWQHVLEPLGGYLHLGRHLGGAKGADFCQSWNFGPNNSATRMSATLSRTSFGCGAAARWWSSAIPTRPMRITGCSSIATAPTSTSPGARPGTIPIRSARPSAGIGAIRKAPTSPP